jgi:hypothetical protein
MTERIVPTDGARLHNIPKSMQDIIDIVGIDCALKIVQHYGGGALYVPKKPETTHQLVEMLGFPIFCKLVSVYNGQFLPIPRCHKAILSARNQQILKEFLAGRSQRKLAYKHNLTERTIHSIVHNVRFLDDYSGNLF